MGVLRRTFRGYEIDESGTSYRTTQFHSLWKLPVWPVATYRVSLRTRDESGTSSGEESEMTKVATDGIQVAHGLLFTFFVVLLIVFTGSLVVVAMTQGLFQS